MSMCMMIQGLVVIFSLLQGCQGHGRLWEPASRVTMWRRGYDNPAHHTDHGFNCGGLGRQNRLGGLCGICGDAYDGPRTSETGGKYANDIITARWQEGSTVQVAVQVTAFHRGYHEFKIAPHHNMQVEVTTDELNQHVLHSPGGSSRHTAVGVGFNNYTLELPAGLTCDQCVLQWRYRAGNNWGICPDGRGALGCGPQEEFYACADISITGDGEDGGPQSQLTRPTTTTDSAGPGGDAGDGHRGTTTIQTRRTTRRHGHQRRRCRAVGVWRRREGMRRWCIDNCNHNPPYCPSTHCRCR